MDLFSLDLLQILQYINLLLFIFIIKNSCSLRRLKKTPTVLIYISFANMLEDFSVVLSNVFLL